MESQVVSVWRWIIVASRLQEIWLALLSADHDSALFLDGNLVLARAGIQMVFVEFCQSGADANFHTFDWLRWVVSARIDHLLVIPVGQLTDPEAVFRCFGFDLSN